MNRPSQSYICPSCGAGFETAPERCPYCGHVNEAADERGFFDELDDEKRSVSELVDIPEETATREVRHAGRLIVIALAVFAALAIIFFILSRVIWENGSGRDAEADYLWTQEMLPEFEAAYREGFASAEDPADMDFSALIELYRQGMSDGAPVWYFERDTFAGLISSIERFDDDLEYADSLKEAGGARYMNTLKLLFYNEIELALIPELNGLNDEERAVLLPAAAPYIDDMCERFGMTEDDIDIWRQRYSEDGYISYSDCEKFVESLK